MGVFVCVLVILFGDKLRGLVELRVLQSKKNRRQDYPGIFWVEDERKMTVKETSYHKRYLSWDANNLSHSHKTRFQSLKFGGFQNISDRHPSLIAESAR